MFGRNWCDGMIDNFVVLKYFVGGVVCGFGVVVVFNVVDFVFGMYIKGLCMYNIFFIWYGFIC